MITRQSKERLIALCPGHDTQRGALDEALLALWAVRVLDNWARKHGHTSPSPILWDAGSETREPVYRVWVPGYELTPDTGFVRRPFQGHNEDAARIVAAEDLVIEDSTLDPIPGLPFT
jgi:hypothetical protein